MPVKKSDPAVEKKHVVTPGSVAPAYETKTETKTEVKPAAAEPRMAPRTMALPSIDTKKAVERESYMERLERLEVKEDGEPSVMEKAAEAVQEVLEVVEELGLAPEQVTVELAVNITGQQGIVCVYCGRPTCNYRPTTYRIKNPEIDLLGDTLTLFQEQMSKVGFSYATVVYDDQDVLVLREPSPPGDQNERAMTLQRYFAFRDRLETPDPKSRQWMQQMLAKWDSSFQSAKRAGTPLDKPMFDVSFKLLESAEGARVKAMIVVSSMTSGLATHAIAARAEHEGIKMSGVAVGNNAAQVAAGMAFPSVSVPDMHALRDQMSDWTKVMKDQIATLPKNVKES
jgi:hypothetical protein